MKLCKMKRIAALILLFCTLFVSTIYGETTQDDIDDAKNQLDNLQQEQDEIQDNISEISNQTDALQNDLNGLNGQLSAITKDMNELETQITEKEAEIATAQEELDVAVALGNQQYEDMKIRIQFMYENSGQTMLETFLMSESLVDFLNRTEYISQINSYDRNKLVEYQQLQEEIAQKKAALESEKTELLALQEDLQKKKESVDSLIASTRTNLANQQTALANAQANASDIESRIAEMEAYEKQLEEQKAREDAARLAAIQAQEQENTSDAVYVPADSDVYVLGAIIQCESDGEPYEGKLAVGSVVLNRVRSSHFPNTISGVIYQSGQFSPVASGRMAYRLEAGVNSTCLQAAQEVLNGNITLNSLYFRTNNGIISGTVIGHHVFY